MTRTTWRPMTRQAIADACKAIRETPLADGRKVWDLLTDEGRRAVAVTERYAAGAATDEELAAARAAVEAVYEAHVDAWAENTAAYAVRAAMTAAYAATYVAKAAEWGSDLAAAEAAWGARHAARDAPIVAAP